MSRMSDYMLGCLVAWSKCSSVDLHIVRMAVDQDQAPFDFSTCQGNITFYDREKMSDADIKGLSASLQPNLIICFGWFDSAYISAVKARDPSVVAVMTMDNQWHGSIRQVVGVAFSRLFLVRCFNFVWVPGERQRRFARLLGFPKAKIRDGLYVANESNFTPIFKSIQKTPKKRLIFVGRFVDVKGVKELWRAFESYHKANCSNLEMLCIGTGPLFEARPSHPFITHLGFVQPQELKNKLEGGGVFVLPSKFEPWGVVVHEFAIAGFPLILSKSVGAADRFLTPENGLLVDTECSQSLQKAFAYIDGLDDATLKKMSEKSRALGMCLTVGDWCAQADEFLSAVCK